MVNKKAKRELTFLVNKYWMIIELNLDPYSCQLCYVPKLRVNHKPIMNYFKILWTLIFRSLIFIVDTLLRGDSSDKSKSEFHLDFLFQNDQKFFPNIVRLSTVGLTP